MTVVSLAALGIGIALAGAPGPVQAVIVTEAARGGVRRGLLAVIGASVGFGILLVPTALGLATTALDPAVLGALRILGGAFLLFLAANALRDLGPSDREAGRGALGPWVKGLLAVLLNPGAWLFVGAVASPLFAEASRADGAAGALTVVLALMVGAASGDAALAVLAGLGLRRGGQRSAWVHRALAVALAALGAWLFVDGLLGIVGSPSA